MYSYADIERVLAELHFQHVDEKLPAFRARLKYLKKLGVPLEEKPGKGRHISYSREHMYKIALALEFCQLGIPPETSAVMTTNAWDKIYSRIFQPAEKCDGSNPVFMVLTPEFMTWRRIEDEEAMYHIQECRRDKVLAQIDRTTDKMGRNTRRKCFLNVSDLVKRINALAEKEAL